MENQTQKWVNLSFLAVSLLVGYVFFTLSLKLMGSFDLEAKIRNAEMVFRIGSILLGALSFLILYKNQQANQFMNEVVTELSRVTWPTVKDTYSSTIVVIVMVLISGALLGLLDFVWTKIIQWII